MDTAVDSAQTRLSSKPLNPDDLEEAVVRAVHRFLNHELPYVREEIMAERRADVAKFEKEQAKNEKEQVDAERERQLSELLKQVLKLPPTLHFLGQLSGWTLGLSPLVLIAGLGYALISNHTSFWWLTAFPLFGLGWYGKRAVEKQEKQLKKNKALLPEVLVLVLPQLDRKNRMQAAYCDAVTALLEQQTEGDEATTHTFLRAFKTLLQTGRRTATRRASIEQAMSRHTVKNIREEADLLDARMNKTSDLEARETLQQSRELLQARLTRAEALEPLRQQMEAQEEVVTQALAEAQSALSGAGLARWAFASGTAGAGDAPPVVSQTATEASLARLKKTQSRLGLQTERVEQAVRAVIVGWADADAEIG